MVPVTIGQDDGRTVQIVSGLKAGDLVIQDPPDSLIEGEKVNPQTPRRRNSRTLNQAKGAKGDAVRCQNCGVRALLALRVLCWPAAP